MNHRRNQSLSTHASQTWPLSHIFLMIMQRSLITFIGGIMKLRSFYFSKGNKVTNFVSYSQPYYNIYCQSFESHSRFSNSFFLQNWFLLNSQMFSTSRSLDLNFFVIISSLHSCLLIVLVVFLILLLLTSHVFVETTPKDLIIHHNKYGIYIYIYIYTFWLKAMGDSDL